MGTLNLEIKISLGYIDFVLKIPRALIKSIQKAACQILTKKSYGGVFVMRRGFGAGMII